MSASSTLVVNGVMAPELPSDCLGEAAKGRTAMPMTRGKARMLESQEEDVGEEPSQPQMPETQDEHEEQQTATEVEADAPAVDLKEMAKQRSQHIVGRLKNASSTILTFGDTSQDARHEPEDDDNEDRPMN
ncbi:hypothetical protein ON010_g16977 [Phytophthora cinnamomi]|nr:hypothetical protein ON010_g16977 [Phytophthora cinnamomi]